MLFPSHFPNPAGKLLAGFLTAWLAAHSLEAYPQGAAPDSSAAPSSALPDSADSSDSPRAGGQEPDAQALGTVTVTAGKLDNASPGATDVDGREIAGRRAATSDSARLLEDAPGVSLYGAGGISSLPVIHGLADDRLRTQVDGMDLMTACPNHMNSALSYIDPTKVASVTVFAGIAPVSAGGDSIGGTIQVQSAPPEFAKTGDGLLAKGQIGAFHRSNGNARGNNLGATLAGQNVNLSYSRSEAQSANYRAADDFKRASPGGASKFANPPDPLHLLGRWVAGDVVGSSEFYGSRNQEIGLALRREDHLLQLNVSEQKVAYEGFPNQRMDMTGNENMLINLRYTGQFQWGELETRLFRQNIRHEMDMGPDRYDYGFGMPMLTEAKTTGGLLKASIDLSERDLLRLGSDFQFYRLNDWWPPVNLEGGENAMCCANFWNVKDGKRDRVGLFAEWEANWNPEWLSLLGIRRTTVKSDAGSVQGYNADPMWGYAAEAAAFNALDHRHTDRHLDLTALMRYTPNAAQTYEAGYARKNRSPNLYERYPWSTNAMAALMNNFVGDGNGYIGNPDLKPETAHTLSATADWHDAERKVWGLKATGYVTRVDDFIDAQRCNFGSCGAANVTTTTSFVLLQYVNQSARLQGIDLSGQRLLGQPGDFGSFTATGVLNYVKGENRTTGDNLYHIMPLNAKVALVHRLGSWTTTAEVQSVAAKKQISQVRNEVPTKGYSLFNLRSSYEWKHARLDIGVENVFNKFYSHPLGGAYLGQGRSMSTNGIAWGLNVPGMGRSVNVALNMHF